MNTTQDITKEKQKATIKLKDEKRKQGDKKNKNKKKQSNKKQKKKIITIRTTRARTIIPRKLFNI